MEGRHSEVLVEGLGGEKLPVPFVVHGLLGGSQVFKVICNFGISAKVGHEIVSGRGLGWVLVNNPLVLQVLLGEGKMSLGGSDFGIGSEVWDEVVLIRVSLELVLVMGGEASG